MNIVIVNGSARRGNTYNAIEALKSEISSDNSVEVIVADKLNISGCKGCGACQCTKGCVANDDTNEVVNKLVDADMIVFATPVYWWGMTAQLKLVIDKCYCKGAYIKNKKIGLIVVGGASTDNEQYDLIEKQFECMAKYLNWNIEFTKRYSASGMNELLENKTSIEELKKLGGQFRITSGNPRFFK